MESQGTSGRPRAGMATLCVALLVGAGCDGRGRSLALGQSSKLAGLWAGPVKARFSWTGAGPAGKKEAPAEEDRTAIAIRADGTFNWSTTTLTFFVPPGSLRRTGDSQTAGLAGRRCRLEVAWSDYTPTSSRVLIRQIPLAEEGTSASAPAERAQGGEAESVAYFEALLNDDDTLSFSYSIFSPASQTSEVVSGRLNRAPPMPDEAELAAAMMKDFPPSLDVIEKKMTRRNLKTPAGNEYVLLTPRPAKGPVPLVVVIPNAPGPKRVESHIARWWGYHCVRFQTAVAIPVLTDPHVLEGSFLGFELRQNTAVATAHAKTVLDVTRAAKSILSPTRTGLVARYEGAVIAGAVWGEDNAQFDVLVLATCQVFTHYPPPGKPRPPARPDAPVFLLYSALPGGEHEVESAKSMVKLYRQAGYTDVTECSTVCNAMDEEEATMVALALGRDFPRMTIHRAK